MGYKSTEKFHYLVFLLGFVYEKIEVKRLVYLELSMRVNSRKRSIQSYRQ